MNDKEKWLQERLKSNPAISADEKYFIDILGETTADSNDIIAAISTLEMLLSLDALVPLVSLIGDSLRSMEIRESAAKAVGKIGPSYVRRELDNLKSKGSPQTRALVEMALEQ